MKKLHSNIIFWKIEKRKKDKKNRKTLSIISQHGTCISCEKWEGRAVGGLTWLSATCHPLFFAIVCHLPSIVHHLPSIIHFLSFIIHCLPSIICSPLVCCPWSVVLHPLSIDFHLLSVVLHPLSLFVIHHLLSVILHSSSFISCLLFVIFCPLLVATSALKSSLKTATGLDQDCKRPDLQSWSFSLRLEDCKKTGCGGPVLSVKTGLFYPSNNISKTTWSLEILVLASLASLAISSALAWETRANRLIRF